MEEFLGEYILNIAKDKINLAILRGKLHMENVELDGTFISSQILSTLLGLPMDAFASISCTALKLKAVIPWGKLEKEPTRFELVGLYLVCVPLTPDTAERVYYRATFEEEMLVNWNASSSDRNANEKEYSYDKRKSNSKSSTYTTSTNPRNTTLRQRTKQAILARMERNYFSWRIPGEGPPRPDAAAQAEQRRKQRMKQRLEQQQQRGRRGSYSVNGGSSVYGGGMSVNGIDNASIYSNMNDDNASSFTGLTGLDKPSTNNNEDAEDKEKDDANTTWMARLRMKIFRNIEVRIDDIHVRCEVCESGQHSNAASTTSASSSTSPTSPTAGTSPTRSFSMKSDSGSPMKQERDSGREVTNDSKPEQKRSFAFGCTLDRLLYKSANSKWETGNINWEEDDAATTIPTPDANMTTSPTSPPKRGRRGKKGSPTTTTTIASTSSPSTTPGRNVSSDASVMSITSKANAADDEVRYKVLHGEKAAIYWDDDPPVLISESRLLKGWVTPTTSASDAAAAASPSNGKTRKGNSNDPSLSSSSNMLQHNLSKEVVNHRVRLAMEQMMKFQDPGSTIVDLLECKETSSAKRSLRGRSTPPQIPHVYWFTPAVIEFRLAFSNIDKPGPTICNAELVPCELDMTFRPKTLQQYRMLHNSMVAQQRLDSMLQQRPTCRPTEDPRAWWKYAISCIVTQQTMKSWRDVQTICQSRSRYIQLVHDHVYHSRETIKGGKLSQQEVDEVQAIQDALPIEVLLAFHLVALRKVVETKKAVLREKEKEAANRASSRRRRKGKSMSPGDRPGVGGSVFNSPNNALDEMSVITESTYVSEMPPQTRVHSQSPSGRKKHGTRNRRRASSTSATEKSNGENDSFSVDDIIQSLSTLENESNNVQVSTPNSHNSKARSRSRGSSGAPSPSTASKGERFTKGDNLSPPSDVKVSRRYSSKSPIPKVPSRRSLSSSMRQKKVHETIEMRPTTLSFESPLDTDKLNSATRRTPTDDTMSLSQCPSTFDSVSPQSVTNGDDDEFDEMTFSEDSMNDAEEPMRIMLQLQQLSMKGRLMDMSGEQEIVVGEMQTGGWINNFDETLKLQLDIHKLEVMDCRNMTKMLTFKQVSYLSNGSLASTSSDFNEAPSRKQANEFLAIPMLSYEQEQFTSVGDVPLPPNGMVCRIFLLYGLTDFSFHVAMNAATFFWNKECWNALYESITSNPTPELRNILRSQLRNVATPLVHKTQLMFQSPRDFSIKMNIQSPKLWIPVSPKKSDGALLLDGGKFKTTFSNPPYSTETLWKVNLDGVQANFCKHRSIMSSSEDESDLFSSFSDKSTDRINIPVISPFNFILVQERLGEGASTSRLEGNASGSDLPSTQLSTPTNQTKMKLSKISLNLMDVEVLAKALGKWYATRLNNLKQKSQSQSDRLATACTNRDYGAVQLFYVQTSLELESIELKLEGKKVNDQPEQEIKSASLSSDRMKLKRAYLIRVLGTTLNRDSRPSNITTKLNVRDISISQMKKIYDSERSRMSVVLSDEPRHKILSFDFPRFETSKSQDRVLLTPGRQILSTPQRSTYKGADSISCLPPTPIDMESNGKDFHEGENNCALGITMTYDVLNQTNDVEVDLNFLTIRITPTSLRDCSTAVGRVMNSVKIMTREMERRIHEAGRSTKNEDLMRKDSVYLLKANLKDVALLSEWPSSSTLHPSLHLNKASRNGEHAVDDLFRLQILFNALVMYQSAENSDDSGKKTVHISIDSLSSSIVPLFERVTLSDIFPIIGPIAAEIRLVFLTNLGTTTSQDFSLDFDSIKCSMTIAEIQLMQYFAKSIWDHIQHVIGSKQNELSNIKQNPMIVEYQTKGSAIATSIRFELQPFSIVILREITTSFTTNESTVPLFDFNGEVRGKLEGCASALTGEIPLKISANSFNKDEYEWENILEPCSVQFELEQLPNEMNVGISGTKGVKVNLTSCMLFNITELKSATQKKIKKYGESTTSPASSPVSSPRISPLKSNGRDIDPSQIYIHNESGVDLVLCSMGSVDKSKMMSETDLFKNHSCSLLKHGGVITTEQVHSVNEASLLYAQSSSIALGIAEESQKVTGKRHILFDLPTHQTEEKILIISRLEPKKLLFESEKRLNHIEPVVEWCMQNQRLRATFPDVESLERGRDFLSSSVWSPGQVDIPKTENHWLHPYEKDDVPEWSDMTCLLQMSRERVMLPDEDWIWVNNWTIDVSGEHCESTDCDGWDYSDDFESFGIERRYYEDGDICRRRRWTRTRMMKPHSYNDPCRPLSLVWKYSMDTNGQQSITIASCLSIRNCSGTKLSFFAFSPNWEKEKFIATVLAGDNCTVPIHLASATYIRLARQREVIASDKLSGYSYSERVMILPTSFISSSIFRASIEERSGRIYDDNDASSDESSIESSHFLIRMESSRGIREITIEPVLKIVNLLPCHLEYRLAEAGSKSVDERMNMDVLDARQVQMGEEHSSVAVCPKAKPMISFRVPGFRWSRWQSIINRKPSPQTWKSISEDEAQVYNDNLGDSNNEHKSLVRMLRLVDGHDTLTVILAIEPGHTPVLRIYAQFWIIDKSSFGLKFCPSFNELLGTSSSPHLHRRSYLPQNEANHEAVAKDMMLQGHEWTMGAHGMTLYFSKGKKMNVAIEQGNDIHHKRRSKSEWSSTLDVSNVMPRTVFSLNDRDQRSYELAYDVSLAPTIYSRTKIIRIFPRYEIVNLMEKGIYITQEGCFDKHVYLPAQTAIPFHSWSDRDLPKKVCLSVESGGHWSNGSIQLDKVGVTSLRLPDLPLQSSVVQAEIRLASRDKETAVVIVLWDSHPLYLLRNKSSFTILCSQPIEYAEEGDEKNLEDYIECRPRPSSAKSAKVILNADSSIDMLSSKQLGKKQKPKITTENNVAKFITSGFECGVSSNDIYDDDDMLENFVWHVPKDSEICFGFDDPDKDHVLQWSCKEAFDKFIVEKVSHVEVDNVGASNVLILPNGKRVGCQIRAERETKIIEFVDIHGQSSAEGNHLLASLVDKLEHHKTALSVHSGSEATKLKKLHSLTSDDDTEFVNMRFRLRLSSISISMIDNVNTDNNCRELLYFCSDNLVASLSLNRDGYQELELRCQSVQVDNHIHRAQHPILISHQLQEGEPFLHVSAVGKLESNGSTVFRYVAVRLLSIDISLDRRTVETLVHYFEPILKSQQSTMGTDAKEVIAEMTSSIQSNHNLILSQPLREINEAEYSVNLGRTYIESLHLHPIRIYVTYTQEWWEIAQSTSDSPVYLQFFRILPSVSKAPLMFTSFVVSHVFEAPGTLRGIITAHYVSQLTKHVFSIIGSIAILNGPADFLTNVGSGVRDFFYEPINGLVHGPDHFIEGLESGSLSLVRGVFVGVVKGAVNVTSAVNSNLAELTDDEFLGERQAYQRSMAVASTKDNRSRTISDSLTVAGTSVALGVRSGAMGIVEKPFESFTKSGPIGFVQGVGKAILGAIVKPVVGVGDGALFLLNHVNDATNSEAFFPMVQRRLHRALPSKLPNQTISLVPYDQQASEAQKIVTSNGTIDDNYIGHVKLKKYLIIASEQYLRVVHHESGEEEALCLSWEEISHFKMLEGRIMQITAFSENGLRSHSYKVDTVNDFAKFHNFLMIQKSKMGNGSSRLAHGHDTIFASRKDKVFLKDIPCMKARQERHTFGSVNDREVAINDNVFDEVDVIEHCFERVKLLGSDQPKFFKSLDENAWTLIHSWSQFSSGLNPRRCVLAGIINGSGIDLQIKMTKLLEGGSPCYHIPTRDYDEAQGALRPGAAIMFFSWSMVPSLLQEGGVSMQIETNGFVCTFKDRNGRSMSAVPCPGYDICFLEKSYDSSGWWAKYWMLVTKC